MGKKRTQSGITNFFSKAGPSDSKISKTSENNDIKATENEKNNDKVEKSIDILEENIENTDTTNVQEEKCSLCAEKSENPFLICKHIACPPDSIGPQAAIGPQRPQGPILPHRPIRPQEPVGAQGFPGRPRPDAVSQYCLNLARSDNDEVFQDIEQQNVETTEEHFLENETETD